MHVKIGTKIANSSIENVSQFKYFRTKVTNQNSIQEEIKWRLNSGNACCQSVQNFLYSCLLSKNVNIGVYKTKILPVVLYGSETWSLISRKEHRLKASDDRVLRRIFALKRDEVRAGLRKLHDKELRDLHSSPSIIRMIKSMKMRCAWTIARMGRNEKLIGYWWKSKRERDHWEDQDVGE
jgi:hypothetical protein